MHTIKNVCTFHRLLMTPAIADEDDDQQLTLLHLLMALDDYFRRMQVDDFECQKRAVCEAHLKRAQGKLGTAGRHVTRLFRLGSNYANQASTAR